MSSHVDGGEDLGGGGDIMILIHGGIRRCRDTGMQRCRDQECKNQGCRNAGIQGSGMQAADTLSQG